MTVEKAPAFQLYAKEFLSDANQAGMSLMETGAYARMMCFEWNEHGKGLPDDPARVARMVGATAGQMRRMWQTLRSCFVVTDGRLIHPRLQKERDKQAAYRRRQSDAGKVSAARRASTTVQPPLNSGCSPVGPVVQPESKSPISYLLSPSPKEESSTPTARSKRPIFTGQKLTIFEWMLDECCKTLGNYTEQFDLHEWFFQLDRQALAQDLVIPKQDGGAWLQSELVKEALSRGIPLRMATAPKAGKQTTTLAAALANIAREDG